MANKKPPEKDQTRMLSDSNVPKALQYKTIKDYSDFFRKSYHADISVYPIMYPLVLCHCIHEYLNTDLVRLHILQEKLNEAYGFIQTIQNLRLNDDLKDIESFECEHLFFIFPSKTQQGWGLTFIDKSKEKGIFPLFLTPDNAQMDIESGIEPFAQAMQVVLSKLDAIFQELRASTWNDALEEKIVDILYPDEL